MSRSSAKTTAEIADAIRPHPLTQANVLVRDPQILRDAAIRLTELEAELAALRAPRLIRTAMTEEVLQDQGPEHGRGADGTAGLTTRELARRQGFPVDPE